MRSLWSSHDDDARRNIVDGGARWDACTQCLPVPV